MNATFLILFFTAFLNISIPTVYFDGGWYMDWGCNVHIGYGPYHWVVHELIHYYHLCVMRYNYGLYEEFEEGMAEGLAAAFLTPTVKEPIISYGKYWKAKYIYWYAVTHGDIIFDYEYGFAYIDIRPYVSRNYYFLYEILNWVCSKDDPEYTAVPKVYREGERIVIIIEKIERPYQC